MHDRLLKIHLDKNCTNCIKDLNKYMETDNVNLTEFLVKYNAHTKRLSELFIETDPISDEQLSEHIRGLESSIKELKIEAQSAVSLRADRRKKLSDSQRAELEKNDRAYVRDKSLDDKPPKTRQTSMDLMRSKLSALGINPDEFLKDYVGK